jgi:hypothetical protein
VAPSAEGYLDTERAAHLKRMRELTELKRTGGLVDGLLADHGRPDTPCCAARTRSSRPGTQAPYEYDPSCMGARRAMKGLVLVGQGFSVSAGKLRAGSQDLNDLSDRCLLIAEHRRTPHDGDPNWSERVLSWLRQYGWNV